MGPKTGCNSDKRYPTGPGFYAQGNEIIIVARRKNPKLGSEVGLEEGYKNVLLFCSIPIYIFMVKMFSEMGDLIIIKNKAM